MHYHPLYKQFFTCYHSKEYWEAHEVLEELWQTERENNFYHGLIQIAAIMHQLERGKIRGARKLATTAYNYLVPYTPLRDGVDIAIIISWLKNCLQILPSDKEKMNLTDLQELNIGVCPLPYL